MWNKHHVLSDLEERTIGLSGQTQISPPTELQSHLFVVSFLSETDSVPSGMRNDLWQTVDYFAHNRYPGRKMLMTATTMPASPIRIPATYHRWREIDAM